MANIHRLIVLLFLSFFSLNSFALVSKVEIYTFAHGAPSPIVNSSSSSYEQLCSIFFDYISSVKPTLTFQYSYCNEDGVRIFHSGVDNWNNSYISGFSYIMSCPQNSTASGSQCTCNEGYEEKDGNSCVLPNPLDLCEDVVSFCRDLTSKRSDFLVSVSYRPDFVCQPLSIIPDVPSNLSGCKVRGCNFMTFSGSVSYKDAFNGKNYTGGEGSYTGSTCHTSDELPAENPNPPENADKPCKVGYSSGLVNGVRLCVPGSDITTDGPKKSEENADGSTSETTTKTVCNNGECTTTETTTTKDASGNVTGSSSSTTKQTELEFCAKEPGSPFCSGVGSKPGNGLEGSEDGKENGRGTFSGTCETGFTCKEGDGISCAIAKSQHEDSCKLFAPAPKGTVPDGTEKDSAKDLQDKAHVINLQTDLDDSGLGWSRSCPADEDYDFGIAGAKLTIPYSKLCVVLSPMSDIALAITALGLLVWLVAGKKEA